jgi:hypothetical protein
MNTAIPKKTVVTTYKNAALQPKLSQSSRPIHRHSEISSLLARADDLGSKNVVIPLSLVASYPRFG